MCCTHRRFALDLSIILSPSVCVSSSCAPEVLHTRPDSDTDLSTKIPRPFVSAAQSRANSPPAKLLRLQRLPPLSLDSSCFWNPSWISSSKRGVVRIARVQEVSTRQMEIMQLSENDWPCYCRYCTRRRHIRIPYVPRLRTTMRPSPLRSTRTLFQCRTATVLRPRTSDKSHPPPHPRARAPAGVPSARPCCGAVHGGRRRSSLPNVPASNG